MVTIGIVVIILLGGVLNYKQAAETKMKKIETEENRVRENKTNNTNEQDSSNICEMTEEEAAKARGEITQQEYFQTITERYGEVLAKCIALVDAHKKHWPELVHQCEDTVKRVGEQSKKHSEALTKIADFVNRVTGAQQPKCVPPPLPKDKAEVIPFLKQYLLYVVKRLCHSWHFRKFLHICMCTLSAVFLCALCIIANDNARLRTIEEKYVLLRDFSRLDDRTSQRADYIEWLYSDEDEHRQEINELWRKRKERLYNKKQK